MNQDDIKEKTQAAVRVAVKWHWALFALVVAGFILLNVVFMASWLGALEIIGIPAIFCVFLLANASGRLAAAGLAVRYGVIIFVFGVLSYGQMQKTGTQMREMSFKICYEKETKTLKPETAQQYCDCASTQIARKMLWPIGMAYLTGSMTKPATAQEMKESQPVLVKTSKDAVSVCDLVVKAAKINK